MEGCAYLVYDKKTVRRLRQIVILHKRRVSVKQSCKTLGDSDAANITEIFERNISELNEKIAALSTPSSPSSWEAPYP